ncbi:glutamyl-tRNA synthetase [Candidatus Gastranaerophilus sp. (ex Termes propinquus)]|nr:glutamyl-tRNA synthetase [Candidatus Gastranaerophilus sp. (ex Termes propinquus)]
MCGLFIHREDRPEVLVEFGDVKKIYDGTFDKKEFTHQLEREFEAQKQASVESKQANVYSGKCCGLSCEEKEALRKQGLLPSIRFRVPKNEQVIFSDLVKKELKFDSNLIGDFVIMKSNGAPVYNFAVVVDDMLMKITHILRGEDHISNTPKQILLYRALGAEPPQFGHLGMILAPDRSKLSKRHGATAVSDFVEKGYLPEALLNFTALLGWAPSDGVEIKSVDEIVQDFRIDELSSSNSVFEYDKLNWMNGQYIKKKNVKELTDLILPYLKEYDLEEYSRAKLERMVEITREPLSVLSEITDDAAYFFGRTVNLCEVEEVINSSTSQDVIQKALKDADSWDFDSEEAIHESLAGLREHFKPLGVKPKDVMWTVRAALTGRTKGADISATIYLLGKDKVKSRLSGALR